uniref:Protein kinase domain-containing protein n=1 Tax=Tetradesmus obliquus TaxID=3088 RepID=A0A383WL77_TETOB|eukprot:jgi/Sobl393_1/11159/SZX78003.1
MQQAQTLQSTVWHVSCQGVLQGRINWPKDGDAVLGSGGYGTVYRGRLRGSTHVAIKVLSDDSQQGKKEFDREVAILGALHHEHLLPLLGSCSERHALVYPLMQCSLEQRL